MKNSELIFFSVPLTRLEPIFKRWIKEAVTGTKLDDVNDDGLLDVKQASELLSLTISTIYTKVCKKELQAVKRGKRLYFERSEIERFLNEKHNKLKREASHE